MKTKQSMQLSTWRIKALRNLKKYIEIHKKTQITLHPDQFKTFQAIVEFIKNGGRKGYVKGPMGYGKTVIFAELCEAIGQRAIIVVPSKLLLHQTKREMTFFAESVEIGLLYGEKKESNAHVIITTYASLVKQCNDGLINPKDFNWIFLDEIHEGLTDLRKETIKKFKHAIKLGFTASDKYTEEKQVKDMLPVLIREISIPEAVREELLCPFAVMFAETNSDMSKIRIKGGDYNKKELNQVVNNAVNNQAAVDLYSSTPYFRGKSTICHCTSIEHAESMASKFCENHFPAVAIHSKMDEKTREQKIFLFRSGKVLILCNVIIATRGFDAPKAEICFNVRPTYSRVMATQRARTLRIDPDNKEKFSIIVDFLAKKINPKYPPITFNRIVDGMTIITPPSWKGTQKLQIIKKKIIPEVALRNLKVYVKAREIMRVTKNWIDRSVNPYLPEEEVRKIFFSGGYKNREDFIVNRPEGVPSPNHFTEVYGKNFSELIHGKILYRNVEYFSEEKTREFISKEGITKTYEYTAKRTIGYPVIALFPKIYKKTFNEIIGKPKQDKNTDWLPLSKVKEIIRKNGWTTQVEYEVNLPSLCPSKGEFQRIYGKTLAEVMHGKLKGRFTKKRVSVSEIKKFFKEEKLSDFRDYDRKRPKGNKIYPRSEDFMAVYGKTFSEVVYGKRKKWKPINKKTISKLNIVPSLTKEKVS
jgi:superfamily II DNA or RNA helicase